MLVDIHIHTNEYSSCSNIDLEKAVIRGKALGLDGLCITDHDSQDIVGKAIYLSNRHKYLIIVGAEILTYEGDLLVFGLNALPKEKQHAQTLVDLVTANSGISIAAHPFRDNGRGMGEHIRRLKGVQGIEAFNGNTGLDENYRAYAMGHELGIPCVAGSDSHDIEQVGKYATFFPRAIHSLKDFIVAVKGGQVAPACYNRKSGTFEIINSKDTMHNISAPLMETEV